MSTTFLRQFLKHAKKYRRYSTPCLVSFKDGDLDGWLIYLDDQQVQAVLRYSDIESTVRNAYSYGIRSTLKKKRQEFKRVTFDGITLNEFVFFHPGGPDDMTEDYNPNEFKKLTHFNQPGFKSVTKVVEDRTLSYKKRCARSRQCYFPPILSEARVTFSNNIDSSVDLDEMSIESSTTDSTDCHPPLPPLAYDTNTLLPHDTSNRDVSNSILHYYNG